MFRVVSMQCGYETGEDRLYLRLPVMVAHKITDGEPRRGCWLHSLAAAGLCTWGDACMRQLPLQARAAQPQGKECSLRPGLPA